MTWARERRSGEPRIIFMHGVELFGVPPADFRSPGDISVAAELEALIEGLTNGRIRWVRLSRAEIMRRKRMHGIEGIPDWILAARADASLLRPVRPVETSPWLRKGSVNKTTEWVPDAVLAAEALEALMVKELAAEELMTDAMQSEDAEDPIEDADEWNTV